MDNNMDSNMNNNTENNQFNNSVPNQGLPYAAQPDSYSQMNQGQQNPYAQTPYTQDTYAQMAGYNQNNYNQGGYTQGGYNQSVYNQGVYGQPGYDQAGYNQAGYNQPGYNQPGYNQPGYIPNAAMYQQPLQSPIPSAKTLYTREQIKSARLLCIISLICYLSPYFIYIFLGLADNIFSTISTSGINGLTSVFDQDWVAVLILFGTYAIHIAGIVLMIIARSKYPKFTFAKVLMWIYIAFTIVIIISIVLLFLFFYWLCSQCAR